MARPLGSRELELWQIEVIVRGSVGGWSRGDIADEAGVSKKTVYNYQRDFALI